METFYTTIKISLQSLRFRFMSSSVFLRKKENLHRHVFHWPLLQISEGRVFINRVHSNTEKVLYNYNFERALDKSFKELTTGTY